MMEELIKQLKLHNIILSNIYQCLIVSQVKDDPYAKEMMREELENFTKDIESLVGDVWDEL